MYEIWKCLSIRYKYYTRLFSFSVFGFCTDRMCGNIISFYDKKKINIYIYKRIADTSRIYHQHVRYLILIRSEQETKTHRKKKPYHTTEWNGEQKRQNKVKEKTPNANERMNEISNTQYSKYDSLRCDLLYVS